MALTEERVEEIKKQLEGLPPEEQQKKLQEILASLSPEEREELTGGGGQCPFCAMVEGKIQVKRVYEDDKVFAILDINPANKGHTLVVPKQHAQFSAQLSNDDFGHLMQVSNQLAGALFEVLKAEGTNILIQNGQVAGQTAPHFLVHVIPRYKDDGVVFGWKPKKLGEEEMNKVENELKKKTSSISLKPKPAKVEVEHRKEERRINRIP